MPFTDQEKLAEIDRELAMRSRVYKWQMQKGTLSREQAQRQMGILTAIRMDYAAKIEAAGSAWPDGPLFDQVQQ